MTSSVLHTDAAATHADSSVSLDIAKVLSPRRLSVTPSCPGYAAILASLAAFLGLPAENLHAQIPV
jgi:hypothetical protein